MGVLESSECPFVLSSWSLPRPQLRSSFSYFVCPFFSCLLLWFCVVLLVSSGFSCPRLFLVNTNDAINKMNGNSNNINAITDYNKPTTHSNEMGCIMGCNRDITNSNSPTPSPITLSSSYPTFSPTTPMQSLRSLSPILPPVNKKNFLQPHLHRHVFFSVINIQLANPTTPSTTTIKINSNSSFNSITNEELEWKWSRTLETKKYFIQIN